MKYPIIADSGANFHMFKEVEFFTSLTPTQGHLILGDGTTKLPIHGIGTATGRKPKGLRENKCNSNYVPIPTMYGGHIEEK